MVSKELANIYCETLKEENKNKFLSLLNSQINLIEKRNAISVNDNFEAITPISSESLRNWRNGTFIPKGKNLLLLIAWLNAPKEIREQLVNYSYNYHEAIPSRMFRYLLNNWDSIEDKISIISEIKKI